MTTATKKQPLSCTQEGCSYTTKSGLYAKQELGRHLKFTHGIAGATKSAKAMQRKKEVAEVAQKLNEMAEKHARENQQAATTELATTQQKRSYQKRGPQVNGYDAEAFITVGYIRYLCEAEAEKLSVPKESFTRRCAELFFASQVRK